MKHRHTNENKNINISLKKNAFVWRGRIKSCLYMYMQIVVFISLQMPKLHNNLLNLGTKIQTLIKHI